MEIAQIAPLYESCPPRHYGGTERVISYLTEELVRLGHNVTLFASGDSHTAARLVPGCERALWHDPECRDRLGAHMIMLHRIRDCAAQFDILHFHTDCLHFPLFADIWDRTVTTMHGRLDLPELEAVFGNFSMMPLVSISDAQRRPVAGANWQQTVAHGLPRTLHSMGPGDGGYLASLGRIAPEKGVDRAIMVARRTGLPLRIAARVDPIDRKYFESIIAPLLDDPLVEFIGEIGEVEKAEFLGRARALLFPIDWPEPFGLVLIEAMANGTPIIAFRSGSVPEIIDDGVTGFIVSNVEEAVAAVNAVPRLDRALVRQRFEERFTVDRMAREYEAVYERVLTHRARRLDPAGERRERAA